MTLNFWRMCIANLLLFVSVYMLFPLLPFVMQQQLEIPVRQTGGMFLAFVAAMLVVGPFHAYLGDEYKRKNVLRLSMFAMLVATLGYAYVDSPMQLLALVFVQGACFGLTTTAGITVAIDITTSARRSAGNLVYAWSARLGMLVGVVLGIWMYRMYGFRMAIYAAVALGVLSMFFISRVYVAFRAPIGMSLCNVDRFFLPRAWLLAVNTMLLAFVPGIMLPAVFTGDYWALLALALLALITVPLTVMFVKLSQHCQRGTANTTCLLATESGLMAGMATFCCIPDYVSIAEVASAVFAASMFLFFFLTYPCYKRKKVRR